MKTSIIVPTAGRPISIRRAIDSLLILSPERRATEIVLVDNNTDETLSADLRAYSDQLRGRVRYLREPSPGLTAARHRGIRESSGEILTFIDDDVEVGAAWLEAIQGAFRNPDVAMVGGPSIPRFTSSIPEWFWGFLQVTPYGGWMCPWLSLIDIGKNVEAVNPGYIWGLNFSIRRSVIEQCRGFHPDLVPAGLQRWQGDGETGLTLKVEGAGLRADYVTSALVFHLCGPDRLNVDYFVKRAFYQGVAESFTWVRAGQDPCSVSLPTHTGPVATRLRANAARVMQKYFGGPFRRSAAAAAAWRAVADAHRAGWKFHQAEAASDPKLLDWVRRADFLDADIQLERAHGLQHGPQLDG